MLTAASQAQIPAGYYDSAEGLTGQPLRAALHNIIDDHTSIPYGDIDQHFPATDKKANGKVWDIYSYVFSGSQPYEYTYGVHECDAGLQYNSEGDCFNKEHIWPQSYFNSQPIPRSDLHHLFPTDGWVNNKRSNFPFGEVSSVDWTSDNGSKVGSSTDYVGYSGKVFEPLDSFKGDVARAIFYTSTRYYTESSGWSAWTMSSGIDLTTDAADLLLSWHRMDSVSTKEIERNNAIYGIQGNRNPYIDYPELVECVWGGICTPLGVEDISTELDYIFSDRILQLPFQAEEILVINTLGKVVHHKTSSSQISVDGVAPGLYVFLVREGEKSYRFKQQVH